MSTDSQTTKPNEAKLAAPSVSPAVVRPETVARFRHAVHGRLTLVCAPAGYGKTTVTAAVIETLGLAGTWYKLDILDHDPATFLTGVTHALRREAPVLGEALLERLRSTTEVPFPVEVMAAALVAECEEHIAAETYLILDDLHEAAVSAGVRRALDYLLANLPPNVHVIALSRYEPAVSMARMRLEGTVDVIGVEDLRFDSAQAGAVLSRRHGQPPPAGQLDSLVRLTEGWPASIVLAGQTIEWLDLESLEAALDDPRLRMDVYSYLAEQVYLREPEASRNFLLRTCCLDILTAELADPLVGIDNSARFLDHLASNRVFTFVDANAGAYRYHNLFREFLTHRFVQDRGLRAFRELQSRTAAILEEAGQVERAIELLLGANEPIDALGAISRGGETLLERCETDRLASWLERLQPGPTAGHPWTLLTQSQMLARTGDYDRALGEIDRALRSFGTSDDGWGVYHALSLKESALYWRGSPEEAAAVCEEALAAAPDQPQRVHTLLSLASAMLCMRRWPEADTALDAAEDLAAHASGAEMARAQGLRGYRHLFTGEFSRAVDSLAPGPWQDRGLHSSAFPVSLAATLGFAELQLANYGPASEILEKALETARVSGLHSAANMVLNNIGLLRGSQGRAQEGLKAVRAAMRGAASECDPAQAAFMRSHEATILRRSGDLAGALERHRESEGLVDLERDPYAALNCRANTLFTESLLGDPKLEALDEVALSARTRHLRFVALKAELFGAIASHALGNTGEARRRLANCIPRQLALGHRHILSQELSLQPELATETLAVVLSHHEAAELMDALARHWRFAETVNSIALRFPRLASMAVQAATSRSTDSVLCEVRLAVRSVRSPWLSEALEDSRNARALESEKKGRLLSDLTRRELQLLALMAEGKRNSEMASQLFISLPTVKTHVNHIYSKLGVGTRVEAVLAYTNGMAT